jgi:hypothetical protein
VLDQNGNIETLASLAGEKDLLLTLNRSFDCCPYCKAQLVGLQGATASGYSS